MSARVIFALGDSDWDWSSVGLTDEFNLAHRALLEPPRVSLDRIMFVFNTKPLALFNLGVHVVPLVVLVRRRLVELDVRVRFRSIRRISVLRLKIHRVSVEFNHKFDMSNACLAAQALLKSFFAGSN
ncbi:hypothetical protein DFH06DRAFT_1483525 [Mycena polygramma]|nr:hypothetical protein DFH06DRAFT_1483525 [Mycena polygramma]